MPPKKVNPKTPATHKKAVNNNKSSKQLIPDKASSRDATPASLQRSTTQS